MKRGGQSFLGHKWVPPVRTDARRAEFPGPYVLPVRVDAISERGGQMLSVRREELPGHDLPPLRVDTISEERRVAKLPGPYVPF